MVLVLESRASGREESSLARYHEVLTVAPEGFVSTYVDQGRGGPPRPVTLRQIHPDDGGVIHTIHGTAIYGDKSPHLRSEACIRLDLGAGRLPGMLAMGCEDPHQFTPQQGADLLTFFGGVFERTMRRWLS